jgi:hypothetical protein
MLIFPTSPQREFSKKSLHNHLSFRNPILSAALRFRPIILLADVAGRSSFAINFPDADLLASSSAALSRSDRICVG